MSQGTLWIQPIQTVFRAGIFVPSAKAYFYLAGTTTPVNVYSDVGLTIPITQPVVADASNGSFQEIFLTPGTAYKVDVQTPAGVSLQGYPADNQLAIPASSSNVSQSGTAGEAISAGQCVYLSDGSGGKNAGQWYKGDSANTYSSSLAEVVGIAPSAVASAASGSFVTAGQVTGLSLTAGTDYFIGSAGALTSTAPANARYVGRSDSVSSIVIQDKPGLLVSPVIKTSVVTAAAGGIGYGICGGRLTLTSGVPVTTGDVTAATSVYFTPYGAGCGNIGLYDGSTNWTILPFAELTIALGTITSGLPYDLFAYNNSGAVALRAPVAWTNGTTRATALVLQNGVLVKSGATTDRYLGSFYTTATTTTEDSVTNRYLYSYYNRVERPVQRFSATANWTYGTNTIRQANGDTANQVNMMIGVSEDPVNLGLKVTFANTSGSAAIGGVGIGLDSTTAFASNQACQQLYNANNSGGNVSANYLGYPGVGKHYLSWLECGDAAATAIIWYGASAAVGGASTACTTSSGLLGSVRA